MSLAQLLHADGEQDAALARLREAVQATEVRRTAVPFFAGISQGTPVGLLLHQLVQRDGRKRAGG